MPAHTQSVEAFISRWEAATGSERANYQLFLTELCGLQCSPTARTTSALSTTR